MSCIILEISELFKCLGYLIHISRSVISSIITSPLLDILCLSQGGPQHSVLALLRLSARARPTLRLLDRGENNLIT